MGHYKNPNGGIIMRSGNGKFRKSTLEDFGIHDGNKNCDTYICNICGDEFIPLTKSYICCGKNDIRIKEKVYTPEQQEIIDRIAAISNKPFINRKDLNDIEQLKRDLYWLDQKTKNEKK